MQQEYRKIDLTEVGWKSEHTSVPQTRPANHVQPFRQRRHVAFFEVVKRSLAIRNREQFANWIQVDLQKIFPHGAMACGLGIVENQGGRIQHLITSNFPLEHHKLLHRPDGVITSPVIAQWIKTRRPVIFELAAQNTNSLWLENFRHSGLQNMAVHGRSDLQSHATSYFNFANIPGKLAPQNAELLELLVPHLHDALIRVLLSAKREVAEGKTVQDPLTKREQEILQWLGSGKTNVEIAQQLHISEHTVKNHVQNILVKLKVSNRAQAVANGLVSK